MYILFTICGRAGSIEVKNKNIIDFLGYPLPFYTYSAINLYTRQNADIDYNIVLNTDSEDLINLFDNNTNIDIDIIRRKKSLTYDYTPKIAVINDCLANMQKRKNAQFDMVVDLDITSPLRTLKDIENLVSKKKTSTADVVFSVTGSRRNPYFNMVKKCDNGYERIIKSDYTARQQVPEIYDMNASLYAYDIDFLESGKGIFDGKCDIITMLDTAVLDIDNYQDLEFMKVIAEYLFHYYPEFNEVKDNIDSLIAIEK